MAGTQSGAGGRASAAALLNHDLKAGTFAPLYCLYGSEDYLKKRYADLLTERISEGNDLNVTKLDGANAEPGQVIEAAMTLPFFAEKRVILVERSGWFRSGGEALAEFLAELPDTACLIFTEDSVDKRSKLWKAASKTGLMADLSDYGTDSLIRWMAGILQNGGRRITMSTAQKIIDHCGQDMNVLSRELDKLIYYTEGRTAVTDDDVEAVCTRSIQTYVFDMVDAIIAGERERALSLYYDLLAAKEPPMRIIVIIAKQFARLAEVSVCLRSGMRPDEIASELKLKGSWLAEKLARQAERCGHERLIRSLGLSVQAQQDIIEGRLPEQIAVEMLIAEA